MKHEIIRIIEENLDTIVNIYKMSKDKDREEIEEHIRSAIQDVLDSEKNVVKNPASRILTKVL